MAKLNPWEPRWTRKEQLGAGGQGHTFRVIETNGSEAVMKLLRKQDSQEARARMHREVVALKTLHPIGIKVPQLLDGNTDEFESQALLYFVMERIQGTRLDKLFADGRSPNVDLALGITLEICSSVAAGHRAGVLHRDLKPENIFLQSIDPPDAVLIDYGLSFNRDVDEELTGVSEGMQNTFLALPELVVHGANRRDPRSDITALCGLLYFLLTTRYPVHLTGPDGKVQHRTGMNSLRVSDAQDARFVHLESFLDKGFAQNIESRFQSIEEFRTRLESVRDRRPYVEIKDPIRFAKESGLRLLAGNRQNQLEKMSLNAKGINTRLSTVLNELQPKLDPYVIKARPPDDKERPKVNDVVLDFTNYMIKYKHAEITYWLTYWAEASNNECVVYRRRLMGAYKKPPAVVVDERIEIVRFEGLLEPGKEILDVIESDFKSAVTDCMKDIESRVA